MKKPLKIAVVQHPPVFMNLTESVNLGIQFIQEAAALGNDIIVFPETWLPGYPVWLDYAPGAGLWDHPPAKALFRMLTENALVINDPNFRKLCSIAKQEQLLVIMGAHEKVDRTLYNTLFYFKSDGSYDLHRKLMPTYTERLIWGMGDGSTLAVVDHNDTRIGGLICWEHWMPLARAAMYQKTEHIHIAQWPMVKELHQVASRNYAFEAQCFVIAAGCTLTKNEARDGIQSMIHSQEDEIALELLEEIKVEDDEYLLKGGSCVIAPDTSYIIEPTFESTELLSADLDLRELSAGNLFIDTNGHYSRPDIFQLKVNTTPKTNVTFEDQ